MDVNRIIMMIMAVFVIIGAADRICGSRLGFGKKFEEGFMTMGPLALSMVGMLVLAPVIANVLSPVIVPLFKAMGADPSMFAGIFLAIDMGGAPLAKEMCLTPEAYELGGIIVGSMLGATIVFTIPVSFEIAGRDKEFIARGILTGIITIPLGCLIGGLAAGFKIGMVAVNLLPVTVISLLIAFGMWKFQRQMIRGFVVFGKFILVISTAGLAIGVFQSLSGLTVIHGMASLHEAFRIVANVVIVLAGAFPLVFFITKVLKKPLAAAGKRLHMNEASSAGLIISLANSIPMFESMKDMDERGKIINSAFAVSGAFVMGDHLGFTAGYEPSMVVPLIIGKLTAGITAVALALLATRKISEKGAGEIRRNH